MGYSRASSLNKRDLLLLRGLNPLIAHTERDIVLVHLKLAKIHPHAAHAHSEEEEASPCFAFTEELIFFPLLLCFPRTHTLLALLQ